MEHLSPKALEIKRVLPGDAGRILSFYNHFFLLSPWSEKYLRNFLEKEERFPLGFYIEAEGKLAGLILGRTEKKDPRVYQLTALLVSSNFRGQGLSKRLVERIIRDASVLPEVKKMTVHFRSGNNLEKYYSKLGFGSCRLSGAYSNGELKYQMERKIERS